MEVDYLFLVMFHNLVIGRYNWQSQCIGLKGIIGNSLLNSLNQLFNTNWLQKILKVIEFGKTLRIKIVISRMINYSENN